MIMPDESWTGLGNPYDRRASVNPTGKYPILFLFYLCPPLLWIGLHQCRNMVKRVKMFYKMSILYKKV